MRRPRKDQLALIAGQGGSAVGSLLLLLVTARVLGPDGRGVFAFFLLWPTLGAYLIAFGVPGANLKLAAEEVGRAGALLGNTALLALAAGVPLAVPLLLGPPSWLVGPMPMDVAWVAWSATVVMVCFNGWTWIQMGLGQFVEPSLLKGAFPAAAAGAFTVYALLADPTVLEAALAWTGCLAVATAWVGQRLRRTHGARLDRRQLRPTLGFGVRYQVGLIAQLVTYRADQWVLGVAAPSRTLGLYSVAVSVSEIATYTATAQGMIRFREASRSVRKRGRRVVATVTVTTVVSAAIVGVAAAVAIPLVFGEAFSLSVVYVLLLLPGVLGVALLRVCGNELSGAGRPGVVSVVAGVQAALMLAAFVVFIPRYGAVAAALVSSVGYLLGGGACAVVMLRAGPRQTGASAVPTSPTVADTP